MLPAGLVTPTDLAEVYGPLAELVAERAGAARPFVVAVTGSVAVGKSAAAAALAAALGPGPPVRAIAVVCTDGFLLPNRVLSARGLADRKGFPESFDHDALGEFVRQVRAGVPRRGRRSTPTPSTTSSTARRRSSTRPDVLVLEGLPFPEDHVDFTVYLDANEDDIERWFAERFHALCSDARTDDASFFRPLADLSEAEAASSRTRCGPRSTT